MMMFTSGIASTMNVMIHSPSEITGALRLSIVPSHESRACPGAPILSLPGQLRQNASGCPVGVG
jgi:hypothetical protein